MLGAKDFGIDLGTDKIRIYMPDRHSMISEPAVVVRQSNTQQIAAYGTAAEKLLQTDGERYVRYELKDQGEVHDYTTVRDTLTRILKQNQPLSFLFHPDLLIAFPHGSSIIERKAMKDLCVQAGFNEKGLYMIDELLASAIGADLPVTEPRGSMVLNIGAGNTQAGVFTLGGLVSAASLHIGGREISQQIVTHLLKEYDLMIDITSADHAKMQVGSLLPEDQGTIDHIVIQGRNQLTGMPDAVDVTTEEMRRAIFPVVIEMIECIEGVLEQVPPDISADLYETGITATGGCAQMKGLQELISEKTGLTMHVAQNPADAVILGVSKVIQDPKKWTSIYSELLGSI